MEFEALRKSQSEIKSRLFGSGESAILYSTIKHDLIAYAALAVCLESVDMVASSLPQGDDLLRFRTADEL
jgi:hypothetical protein